MKRLLNVTAEFKRAAVSRVAGGEAVSSVASDLGIDRRRLYEWQEQVRQGGLEALRRPGRATAGWTARRWAARSSTRERRHGVGSRSSSARSASSRATSIFFGKP